MTIKITAYSTSIKSSLYMMMGVITVLIEETWEYELSVINNSREF